MEFTRKEHEMWFSRLRGIAVKWSHEYSCIDEDEAYSELMCSYGEAIVRYDPDRDVKFENFFYFYRKKAFDRLMGNRVLDTSLDNLEDDSCMLRDDRMEEAFRYIILKMDVEGMMDDVRVVLAYLMEKGLVKANGGMGCYSVAQELQKFMNWSYNRSLKAAKALRSIYREYRFA